MGKGVGVRKRGDIFREGGLLIFRKAQKEGV